MPALQHLRDIQRWSAPLAIEDARANFRSSPLPPLRFCVTDGRNMQVQV
jgi:hypothetical protein